MESSYEESDEGRSASRWVSTLEAGGIVLGTRRAGEVEIHARENALQERHALEKDHALISHSTHVIVGDFNVEPNPFAAAGDRVGSAEREERDILTGIARRASAFTAVRAREQSIQANVADLLRVARLQPVAMNAAGFLIPAHACPTTVAEHECGELVQRGAIWMRRPVDLIGRKVDHNRGGGRNNGVQREGGPRNSRP